MESRNNEFQGFQDEDLDPLVFVENKDNPELREDALAIPRPTRDENYIGPKKSRSEILAERYAEEQTSTEWVPTLAEENPSLEKKPVLELVYNNIGKVILFAIPMGIIFFFINYAATQL